MTAATGFKYIRPALDESIRYAEDFVNLITDIYARQEVHCCYEQ